MKRRVPYDASRKSLYHPGDADDFFRLGDVMSPAGLCAEMSRLAYVKEAERLEEYLARARFVLARRLAGGSTEGFVARGALDGKAVVVAAFRGTESDDPTDLFTDSQFIQQEWEAGGRVHRGFAQGFGAVRDDFLDATKDAGETLLLTGHSLGAALATVASTLRQEARLFTFGSPRVGDDTFRQSTSKVVHERFVDCCDMVTRVPPEKILHFGYVHAGTLRFIDADGIVRDWSPEEIEQERVRASRQYVEELGFLHGKVAIRELADHAPINYVSVLP